MACPLLLCLMPCGRWSRRIPPARAASCGLFTSGWGYGWLGLPVGDHSVRQWRVYDAHVTFSPQLTNVAVHSGGDMGGRSLMLAVALASSLVALPVFPDEVAGMRVVPSSAPLNCVDGAGHMAWCGPSPTQYHECRAQGPFARCSKDPACFDRERQQVVCVRPVTPSKKS